MYKAYKFRLYPTPNQKELIEKTFGCCRYVYNYYLNKMQKEGYKAPYNNINDYTTKLKYDAVFLQEIDSIIIIKTLYNLDNAFKQKNGNCNAGNHPRYKSKYKRNSYNIPAVYNSSICSNIELDLTLRQIKLPKLDWIIIKGYRNINRINGKIKNATISREQNGKYYVSILYEMPNVVSKANNKTIVGIDLGVKKLLTLSDGTTYDNNKYINKYEKRIKRKQKELARKITGSKNYYKCLLEINILYSKLANARKYYIHKITKEITDGYDIITCENLNTKQMIINGKKSKLSKKINDASFNEIIRQLSYKAKFKGKIFNQIGLLYPSSQICSRCSNQDKKYKNLNEREYKCTKCNLEIDRDFNASINIMFEGLKLYMKSYA